MNFVNKWVLSLTVGCFLGAQAITEDPVMKARLHRVQAQGIEESDLPPVPRGVAEPPPLPPPDVHPKDLPHAKAGRAGRRHGARTHAGTGAAQGSRQARKPARPAGKVARKTSGRVKA